MNVISIAGRLGADCILKRLPSGKEVVNFSVAVDVNRGENKQTQWVDCSLWGERAAKLAPYLTRGKQVALCGNFNLRVFEKKDGTAGAALTCDVRQLTLMGGREADDRQQTPVPRMSALEETPSKADFDDHLPF